MRWGIHKLLVSVVICWAGCTAQAAQQQSTTPQLTTPKPTAPQSTAPATAAGPARLSITRVDGSSLFGSTVHIAVNDVKVADLAEGQTYKGGLRTGPVSVTVSGTADIGQYIVRFNAVPGRTYAFQVSKRTQHTVAGIVGGLAGLLVETAVSGEHAGSYQLTPVKP
ncbi:MAG TPA: hypothetical protein VH206_14155 [Xanthobacteraceae bacterium]|jgi:hypothetical protein|nr:hypothetical protein [Xanthobacteraceae bacterium]